MNASLPRQLVSRVSIVLLVIIAVSWPVFEIGPKGKRLVSITHDHGIDTGDLMAPLPLSAAVALARHRREQSRLD